MVDIRVPYVRPDDSVSSFTLESQFQVPVSEFPQSFAGCHAEQQIVFVVARDRGAVLSLFRKRSATNDSKRVL